MGGKSANYTDKGTKQRSFNLDDETFAIVEAEAKRLHVTNSAALSMVLHNSRDTYKAVADAIFTPSPEEQTQRVIGKEPALAAPFGGERNIALPDPKVGSFDVVDPANAGKDGDAPKPGKASVRAKHLRDDDFISGQE